MKQIFIISGESGSGKTTLARVLAPHLGARLINAGDVVLATIRAHGIMPRSRPEAGRLFLNAFGEDALGPLLMRIVLPFDRVIIDGLRLPATREFLTAQNLSIFQIHLDVSNESREFRLAGRDGHVERDNSADGFAPYMMRSADQVLTDSRMAEISVG